MDGFTGSEGVVVLAATNRPDVLDPALLRPGRFDRQIVVHAPDHKGRMEILRVHTRKVPLAKDVDLDQLAASTPGMTGADLANRSPALTGRKAPPAPVERPSLRVRDGIDLNLRFSRSVDEAVWVGRHDMTTRVPVIDRPARWSTSNALESCGHLVEEPASGDGAMAKIEPQPSIEVLDGVGVEPKPSAGHA